MTYQELKARQRVEREGYPPSLSLRMHRALSWLNRAEQLVADRDGKFIFLSITSNVANATDIDKMRFLASKIDQI